MFEKLKAKWGVGPLQLTLILITFAIGGSLSGYLAKIVIGLLDWEKSFLWWVVYILVVTCLWPLCVISVSVIFGQYPFFKKYLQKMGRRFRIIKN
ncbi:MAG: hypothetical protein HKN16_09460 [Saprospiraceae bacterium]|nr:hypothetical protein [Saprospiraceae bacterium]